MKISPLIGHRIRIDRRLHVNQPLQIGTLAWAKHLLLEIIEVKRTVMQISDLRSELTKLTNKVFPSKLDRFPTSIEAIKSL